MFENITAESLRNRMLSKVSNKIDKREGSIIYDAIMPAAIELKHLYIELDILLNETFGDTATRKWLIKRAHERGIVPYTSSHALVKGVFNIDVPIGSRFNLNNLNYTVTEKISDGVFRMECEMTGSEANRNFGQLIPIEYIPGLTSCEITEVLIPGEDEEETEAFRQRYFDTFNSQAYGGNVPDYRIKAKSVRGVGGVKVYRAHEWNGGGTVKLVITDSDYNVPSAELVDKVQTTIDPVVNNGEGIGLAPIGHFVTVCAVNSMPINIELHLVYEEHWNWDRCALSIESAIDDYFYSLNRNWENENQIVVRIAQIEACVLELTGIVDVIESSINGTSRNIIVDRDTLVTRGEIHEKNG